MEKSKSKEYTIKAILYTYYSRKEDGRHPVRIQVTANRKSKFYPVQYNDQNIFLSQEEWNNINDKEKNHRGENRKIKERIDTIQSAAVIAKKKITHGDKSFSFDKFENEFLHQESKKGFFEIFKEKLEQLKEEERIGTAVSYTNALVAFKDFRKGKDLKPEEITAEMLKQYDIYLRKEKVYKNKKGKTRTRKACNKTTVGIYMRGIKVIYNYCISKNPDLLKNYPFSKNQSDTNRYKIKKGPKNNHKGEALSLEELKTFIGTNPIENSAEWVAKQWWMLSFYCQGMNFRDICYLTHGHIDEAKGLLTYVRCKTRDTEKEEVAMEIPFTASIKEIISKLTKSKHIGRPNKDSYVFDVLQKDMNAVVQDSVIKQKIKNLNKWLKRLSKDAGLPEITSYWARHSYANLLKQSDVDPNMIRELLGHSDLKTTEVYLKRFDLSKKLKVSENIQTLLAS